METRKEGELSQAPSSPEAKTHNEQRWQMRKQKVSLKSIVHICINESRKLSVIQPSIGGFWLDIPSLTGTVGLGAEAHFTSLFNENQRIL